MMVWTNSKKYGMRNDIEMSELNPDDVVFFDGPGSGVEKTQEEFERACLSGEHGEELKRIMGEYLAGHKAERKRELS